MTADPDTSSPLDPESNQQFQPPSPKTLAQEPADLQTIDRPDADLLSPQVSLPQAQTNDEEQEAPIFISNSPPNVPQDPHGTTAGATTTAIASFPRRGVKGKKQGKKWRLAEKKIKQKLDSLLKTLKLVPFVPARTLDFARHEDLLKQLGLWDFVHLPFERVLRTDLIAQLIASFSKGDRCSYVNGVRILVNRADLARALKIQSKKKEKGSQWSEIVTEKPETDESIAFLTEFVSHWVLLHDDTWMMPDEIRNYNKMIQEGSFDKVDWAGMVWFMVDKELEASELENCYYASHLQCLIRSQKEGFFGEETREEIDVKDDEEDVKTDELEEQSLELSLGPENIDAADADDNEGVSTELGVGRKENLDDDKAVDENLREGSLNSENDGNAEVGTGHEHVGEEHDDKEQGREDAVMDSEECKEGEEEHSAPWLLGGKNERGEHFMQRCSFNSIVDMDYSMDQKEEGEEVEDDEVEAEEEEEEVEEEEREEEQQVEEQGGFHLSPNSNDFDGLSPANLIQVMENNQMTFGSELQMRDNSCGEFLASRAETHLVPGRSSVFNDHKRELEHDNGLLHPPFNGSNKRLRTDGTWDGKSSDMSTCIEQLQHWAEKARMIHEGKEQMYAESSMNQQILINEVQRRDSVIEQLHKARTEEQQKARHDIYKLERELIMMTSLLDGYRKALKETNRAFSEYRARCPQLDETMYKDVPNSGGLVLGNAELEKQRVKREEEERYKVLLLRERIMEFDEQWTPRFQEYCVGVEELDGRLLKIEEDWNAAKELLLKRKTQNAAPEGAECVVVPASETAEHVTSPATETADPTPAPETASPAPSPAPETADATPETAEYASAPEIAEECIQTEE